MSVSSPDPYFYRYSPGHPGFGNLAAPLAWQEGWWREQHMLTRRLGGHGPHDEPDEEDHVEHHHEEVWCREYVFSARLCTFRSAMWLTV